jgi:ABC-type Fe3+/spermidine/putrescine transport system ATPase subunit
LAPRDAEDDDAADDRGFRAPVERTLYLGDEDVTRLPPNKRDIGMVFQDYALFPHDDRRKYRLRTDGAAYRQGGDQPARQELLNLVQLADVEAGIRRALGRPAAADRGCARRSLSHQVLLMDEPLGTRDLKLREAMQTEMQQIQQRLGTTTIYITHDQTEAMHMSDRIVVMKDGMIEQMGSAEEIYNRPRTRFVADFIGQINLLDGAVIGREDGFAVVDVNGVRVRIEGAPEARGEVTVGIRPQHLALASNGVAGAGCNLLPGRSRSDILRQPRVHRGRARRRTGVTIETRPEDATGDAGTKVSVQWRPERGRSLPIDAHVARCGHRHDRELFHAYGKYALRRDR